MGYQSVFRRYELKYILDREQERKITDSFCGRMVDDQYAHSSIDSTYYDTDTYTLAVHSASHPMYKEKLRIRRYSQNPNDPVFVEIKKKYDSVTYKRRISLREDEAKSLLDGKTDVNTQIGHEIEAFRNRYPTLSPKIAMHYERDSYKSTDSDLRITFDKDVRASVGSADFIGSDEGICLIPDKYTIMEIKTGTAIPLWLTHTLSEASAYPGHFSKYGTAYRKLILANP